MARNRKDNSALRLGPALTAVALCAFFVALGVGFVWYKEQIGVLGRQIKEREVRLAELQRENKVRRVQLATLCSSKELDLRVRKLDPSLGPPAFSQVIRLVDAPDVAQAPDQHPAEVVLAQRKN